MKGIWWTWFPRDCESQMSEHSIGGTSVSTVLRQKVSREPFALQKRVSILIGLHLNNIANVG